MLLRVPGMCMSVRDDLDLYIESCSSTERYILFGVLPYVRRVARSADPGDTNEVSAEDKFVVTFRAFCTRLFSLRGGSIAEASTTGKCQCSSHCVAKRAYLPAVEKNSVFVRRMTLSCEVHSKA